MLKIILFSLFFSPAFCFSSNYRTCLDSAMKCRKYTEKFIAKLEQAISKENSAYLGVAYIMKSNHVSFPFAKLKYFYKGKKVLDKAIAESPNNVEFIYYRYEIQNKIPRALGYDNRSEDLKQLRTYIANSDNKKRDIDLYNQINKIL